MRALTALCLTVVCGLQTVLADIDLAGVFPPEVKCVHLVAPSSLPPKETVIRMTNALAQAGYRVKISPGVWSYLARFTGAAFGCGGAGSHGSLCDCTDDCQQVGREV